MARMTCIAATSARISTASTDSIYNQDGYREGEATPGYSRTHTARTDMTGTANIRVDNIEYHENGRV